MEDGEDSEFWKIVTGHRGFYNIDEGGYSSYKWTGKFFNNSPSTHVSGITILVCMRTCKHFDRGHMKGFVYGIF